MMVAAGSKMLPKNGTADALTGDGVKVVDEPNSFEVERVLQRARIDAPRQIRRTHRLALFVDRHRPGDADPRVRHRRKVVAEELADHLGECAEVATRIALAAQLAVKAFFVELLKRQQGLGAADVRREYAHARNCSLAAMDVAC